jgi:hypothetical protein
VEPERAAIANTTYLPAEAVPIGSERLYEVAFAVLETAPVYVLASGITGAGFASIPIVRGIPSSMCLETSRLSGLTMAGLGRMIGRFSGATRPEASMAARAGFTIMLRCLR